MSIYFNHRISFHFYSFSISFLFSAFFFLYNSDAPATIAEIVKCSKMAISIVIVGVGDADFSQMEVLDGDDGVLKDRNGNAAERDCVQFVEFQRFKNKPISALAAETLREIPEQFVTHMQKIGAKPQI